MTTIAAIETTYQGHRFRSRLEARWAVLFDHLGIKWQYEQQGYLIGDRKRPYLPDFRLPGLGVWAEVKGDPAGLDISLLDDAVKARSGLPSADPYGDLAVLILGEIPPPDAAYLHWMVSRTVYAACDQFCACADLHFSQVTFAPVDMPRGSGKRPPVLLTQIGRQLLAPPHGTNLLVPQSHRLLRPHPDLLDAYQAARSARFEHGEAPVPFAATDGEMPKPVSATLHARIADLRRSHGDVTA